MPEGIDLSHGPFEGEWQEGSIDEAIANHFEAERRNYEKRERKRLNISRRAPLPPYNFAEYPKMLYRDGGEKEVPQVDGSKALVPNVLTRTVADRREEEEALQSGWVHHPSQFGDQDEGAQTDVSTETAGSTARKEAARRAAQARWQKTAVPHSQS